jgi:hypothetical protein
LFVSSSRSLENSLSSLQERRTTTTPQKPKPQQFNTLPSKEEQRAEQTKWKPKRELKNETNYYRYQ